MGDIIGFYKVDIIITNSAFMNWYNDIYNTGSSGNINDFVYQYNGEDAPSVIEKYISYRFNLDTFNANVTLWEPDTIEFPQRIRFLAKTMIKFETEIEFNHYKISKASSYSELCKIKDNPIYVNPDYIQC